MSLFLMVLIPLLSTRGDVQVVTGQFTEDPELHESPPLRNMHEILARDRELVPQDSYIPGGCGTLAITVSSIKSGLWSDPTTWSTGKVPTHTSRVAIVQGHRVDFDLPTDARIACVNILGGASLRMVSSILVANRAIITPTDRVPRFCGPQAVTVQTVRSGRWFDSTTWSDGKVPPPGARVSIGEGHVVDFDALSDTRISCIEIGGTLQLSTVLPTRLMVQTITVLPQGTLTIGTESAPVSPSAKAEIIFTDVPLDRATDPFQFSNGLLGFGKVSMQGTLKEQTFVRLREEHYRDDTVLRLTGIPSGWQIDDRLYIPSSGPTNKGRYGCRLPLGPGEKLPGRPQVCDSKQIFPGPTYDYSVVTITGIDAANNSVTVDPKLPFDHLGVRDAQGNIAFLPHVANLTRNVVLRSQTPKETGKKKFCRGAEKFPKVGSLSVPCITRGHVLFSQRADVDVQYASFLNLGRTVTDPIERTQANEQGAIVQVGNNHLGRYSLHTHHLLGPVNPTNQGYQVKLIGNVVEGFERWGIVLHNTSYGLVRGNVVFNGEGAGIVTEDRNCTNNIIEKNLVGYVKGYPGLRLNLQGPQRGSAGFGYYMEGKANNTIQDNVGYQTSVMGMLFYAYGGMPTYMPPYRGAPHNAFVFIAPRWAGPTVVSRNEMALMTDGFDIEVGQVRGTVGTPPLKPNLPSKAYKAEPDFGANAVPYSDEFIPLIGNKAFATFGVAFKIEYHESTKVKIADAVVLGDKNGAGPVTLAFALDDIHMSRPTRLENATIHGVQRCVDIAMHGSTEIIGGTCGYDLTGVRIKHYNGDASDLTRPTSTLIDGLVFLPPSGIPPQNIEMRSWRDGDVPNSASRFRHNQLLTRKDTVDVRNYNGTAGDDFSVYYYEQAGNEPMPWNEEVDFCPLDCTRTKSKVVSCPPFSQVYPLPMPTNQECWNTQGKAFKGEVAPCSITRQGILGLVCAVRK